MATSARVTSDEQPTVEGTVSRIVFANPENHWCVFHLVDTDAATTTCVVGVVPGVREGEHLRVHGEWVEDVRYGRQLRAHRTEVVLPASAEGIERYLGSGRIPGIGAKTAALLVETFGERTLEVLDREPQRLMAVRGIGEKRLGGIVAAWKSGSSARDALVFLQGLGIGPSLAGRIVADYGADAGGRVRADPYALSRDFHGVGFLTADRVASRLGVAQDAPVRVRAGIVHALEDARSDGHVCLPAPELRAAAEQVLGVGAVAVADQLDALVASGRLVADGPEPLIYTPDLSGAEERTAANLVRLTDYDPTPVEDPRLLSTVASAESRLRLELGTEQRRAVLTALTARVTVITGGPGTGKTTSVRAGVDALELLGERVLLAAPTGRAAKRLALATGRDARTLHRVLEWQPGESGFLRDEYEPLEADALVVDEVSMVDLPLFDQLVRAIPDGGRLVLVGDVDQLPSVGPGAVLRDVIDSGAIPVVRLLEIYRQAAGSQIVVNAHRILGGELPRSSEEGDPRGDFYWIERDRVEDIQSVVCRVVTERIPRAFRLDPVRDVQVLTPMNRGPLGTGVLNELLGAQLNPDRSPALRLAPGDKVMQVKNNYEKEVFNGDLGFVEALAGDGATALVRFDEAPGREAARLLPYEPDEQDQLVPAWAVTIHKAQGSEYPAVVLPLHTQHFMMLRRNLLYTAVTRGRDLVVVVGSRKALAVALGADTVAPRYGRLAARLRELAR